MKTNVENLKLSLIKWVVKDNFYSFLFSKIFIIFTYTCIAENVMMNDEGHRVWKMMLNTPTFANNFDFIWIFSYSHLSSPLVVTKH